VVGGLLHHYDHKNELVWASINRPLGPERHQNNLIQHNYIKKQMSGESMNFQTESYYQLQFRGGKYHIVSQVCFFGWLVNILSMGTYFIRQSLIGVYPPRPDGGGGPTSFTDLR